MSHINLPRVEGVLEDGRAKRMLKVEITDTPTLAQFTRRARRGYVTSLLSKYTMTASSKILGIQRTYMSRLTNKLGIKRVMRVADE